MDPRGVLTCFYFASLLCVFLLKPLQLSPLCWWLAVESMWARLVVVGTGSAGRSHSSHRRSLVNKVSLHYMNTVPLQGLSKRMSVCLSPGKKIVVVQSLLTSWKKTSQARQRLCQFHLKFLFRGTAILGPICRISAISEGPSLSKASGAHANV